jgi:hypothetical protein
LIKLVQNNAPTLLTHHRIHIVQHSNWNQDNTSSDALAYVKANCDYHKIPDGNAINNGSAGYKSEISANWTRAISNNVPGDIWHLAKQLAYKYNGQEGRYNNESIAKGEFDFSDAAEVTWILDIEEAHDVTTFFDTFLH